MTETSLLPQGVFPSWAFQLQEPQYQGFRLAPSYFFQSVFGGHMNLPFLLPENKPGLLKTCSPCPDWGPSSPCLSTVFPWELLWLPAGSLSARSQPSRQRSWLQTPQVRPCQLEKSALVDLQTEPSR